MLSSTTESTKQTIVKETCDICGGVYLKRNRSMHKKSEKHLFYNDLKNKQNEIEIVTKYLSNIKN